MTLAEYYLTLELDNSISMRVQQNGERIETLKKTLQRVSFVYNFVSEAGGIVAIKYLNERQGRKNVKPGHVDSIINKLRFQGLTPLGSGLRDRVLKEFADCGKMKRPLLVIVLTDGEVAIKFLQQS